MDASCVVNKDSPFLVDPLPPAEMFRAMLLAAAEEG